MHVAVSVYSMLQLFSLEFFLGNWCLDFPLPQQWGIPDNQNIYIDNMRQWYGWLWPSQTVVQNFSRTAVGASNIWKRMAGTERELQMDQSSPAPSGNEGLKTLPSQRKWAKQVRATQNTVKPSCWLGAFSYVEEKQKFQLADFATCSATSSLLFLEAIDSVSGFVCSFSVPCPGVGVLFLFWYLSCCGFFVELESVTWTLTSYYF